MIIHFGSNSFRECKIYLGELPLAQFFPKRLERREYKESHQGSISLTIAVELFIARGATFSYGLLGGTFVGDDSRSLKVEIASSNTGSDLFVDAVSGSLAARDKPTIFLPDEFVPGVIEGLERSIREMHAISGKLTISHAVCGQISSSHNVFKNLSSILWAIVVTSKSDNPVDESSLEAIINKFAI